MLFNKSHIIKVNRYMIMLPLLCISCTKEKKNQDLTALFTGSYSTEFAEHIIIHSQDSLQTIGITGLSISPVSAIVTDENNFQIATSVEANLPVYSGGGCWWCLSDSAHLLKMTGTGILSNTGITISTSLYRKNEHDQEFSFYKNAEYKLIKD